MLRKNILDAFGAGFLVVGTDTAGSYNLAESGQSLHSYFIEDHVHHIKSLIDNDLIPEILAINGIKLNYKDTPKIICSPLGNPDIDIASKMVQRLRATNSIVLTKDNIISWHERNGFDVEHMYEMTEEELIEKLTTQADESMQTRSGDGMASASGGLNGTGDELGMDNSTNNSENAA